MPSHGTLANEAHDDSGKESTKKRRTGALHVHSGVDHLRQANLGHDVAKRTKRDEAQFGKAVGKVSAAALNGVHRIKAQERFEAPTPRRRRAVGDAFVPKVVERVHERDVVRLGSIRRPSDAGAGGVGLSTSMRWGEKDGPTVAERRRDG